MTSSPREPLRDGSLPLVARYRGLVCDLDGVVYRGPEPVPGAIETLDVAIADGMRVVFATNNASRPPDAVGTHLADLGLRPAQWSVVTSSQAAAAYLADRVPRGARVCAVGGPGVSAALAEVGLRPVRAAELGDQPVVAVVQGLGVDVTGDDLAEVAHLVDAGAEWVVTNQDMMLPTARGPAPGNGALVAAVRTATSATPHVVGKPHRPLYDLARSRLGTALSDTLACGDRLDTDIAGAIEAGLDSLLVLSGAARLRDVAFAPSDQRPTYLAADLRGLLAPAQRLAGPGVAQRPGSLAAPAAEVSALGVPRLDPDADPSALVAAVWAALDAGRPVSDADEVWGALEARRFGTMVG